MDTVEMYRQVVRQVLTEQTRVPYAHGNIAIETVFDTEGDHYLVLTVGWDGVRRIHGCLVHIDIAQGKVWVQRDGTEQGVALALMEAGIPKDQIVLGFQPVDVRPYTEFAVA